MEIDVGNTILANCLTALVKREGTIEIERKWFDLTSQDDCKLRVRHDAEREVLIVSYAGEPKE